VAALSGYPRVPTRGGAEKHTNAQATRGLRGAENFHFFAEIDGHSSFAIPSRD
jgi:hypothetical protein